MTTHTAALASLHAALPGRVRTGPAVEARRRDESVGCPAGRPLAVVAPRTTAEVSAAVRVAAEHGLSVVPQGALTGLTGAANAVDDAVVLDMTGMDAVLRIDPDERVAVVQPGVLTGEFARVVAAEGLWYPPDPGSRDISTIGGNVATDAGGMCCLKYGVTGTYVLGAEVVLADGDVLRCGRSTAKGNAGYDVTSLFVGSEGTLGVLTEITLKLLPAPRRRPLTVVATFPDAAAAGEAVAEVVTTGLVPTVLELLDRTVLTAVEQLRPLGIDPAAGAMLIGGIGEGAGTEGEAAAFARCCRRAGADDVIVARDDLESDALMEARRSAHWAMVDLARRTFPDGDGAVVVDDVAVPRAAVAALVTDIARIAAEHDVTVGVLGHAGDGNVHPVIVLDRADPAVVRRAWAAFDAIVATARDLGGTCSGEHGIGLLKRDWLATELGPVGLRVHRAVKAALDPAGLFNPGKVLAPDPAVRPVPVATDVSAAA